MDESKDRWNELRNFNSLHSRFPLQRRSLRRRSLDAVRRNGAPITADDVLDFHLTLKGIYGIDKNERDFFARFAS
jgi:predicted deacylase